MELPEIVVGIIAPIVLAIMGVVLTQLGLYLQKLKGQVKSKTLANIIDVVGGVALTAVSTVMETSVRHIKTAAADGKLTAEEAKAATLKALDLAWDNLTAEMKDILTKEAGTEDEAKRRFIAPSISAAVLEAKTVFSPTLDKPRTEVTQAQLLRAREFLTHR